MFKAYNNRRNNTIFERGYKKRYLHIFAFILFDKQAKRVQGNTFKRLQNTFFIKLLGNNKKMKSDFKLLYCLYLIVSLICTFLLIIIANVAMTSYKNGNLLFIILFIFNYFILFLNCALAKVLNDYTENEN